MGKNMHDTPHITYALVSAARNEEQFIELTIKSVVAQTVRPIQWVIVSDGSTDDTDEIVRRYASQYPWITLLSMPERKERDFGGKVSSIRAGLAHLGNLPFDVIGNLDADVSFGPRYFEFILHKFEDDPRLGVVGTALREGGKNKYDYHLTLLAHVSGPCQIFRRRCYEEIGGYAPLKYGGVDFAAVWNARARGWETRTFPEIAYEHHRPMSSATHAGLAMWVYTGRMDYLQGNHPIWEFLRCLNQMRTFPYVVGGLLMLFSYTGHALQGRERILPDDAVRLLRREQLLQIQRLVFGSRRVNSTAQSV